MHIGNGSKPSTLKYEVIWYNEKLTWVHLKRQVANYGKSEKCLIKFQHVLTWLETGSPNSFLAALVSCRVSSDVEPPAPQVKSVKSGPKAFQIQKGENCTRN